MLYQLAHQAILVKVFAVVALCQSQTNVIFCSRDSLRRFPEKSFVESWLDWTFSLFTFYLCFILLLEQQPGGCLSRGYATAVTLGNDTSNNVIAAVKLHNSLFAVAAPGAWRAQILFLPPLAAVVLPIFLRLSRWIHFSTKASPRDLQMSGINQAYLITSNFLVSYYFHTHHGVSVAAAFCWWARCHKFDLCLPWPCFDGSGRQRTQCTRL